MTTRQITRHVAGWVWICRTPGNWRLSFNENVYIWNDGEGGYWLMGNGVEKFMACLLSDAMANAALYFKENPDYIKEVRS